MRGVARVGVAGGLLALMGVCAAIRAQSPPSVPSSVPVVRRDVIVDAASDEIGRALFLRCLCADDDMSFDAQGRVAAGGRTTPVEWTLAGVNILSVERASASLIELTGVRVAIRFAPDRHEFERHPQKDEEVRVTVRDNGDLKSFQRALAAVFAQGIDLPLQRSLPPYWQHYFDPALPWPTNSPDVLAGQTVQTPGTPERVARGQAPADPAAGKQVQAASTPYADRDHIRGMAVVRFVVDTEGVPRRLALQLPMGYGLDQKAIAAVAAMRFTPATMGGNAVPVTTVVRVDFVPSTPVQTKPR